MQTQIRETDESLFPNKQRFIQLKDSNSLSDPDETGKRLVHYLLSPNFGKLAVDALFGLDYALLQAVVIVFTLLYVTASFLVDVLYAVIDPRIRYT